MQLLACIGVVVLAFLIVFPTAAHGETVHLISGEKIPYIGRDLKNYGYALDVAQEAFKREGYEVSISFYPWARANYLIKQGKYDGIMPVHRESMSMAEFTLSAPFPGDTIGLLKRQGNPYTYASPPEEGITKSLSNFANKSIGVVRGAHLLPNIESISSIKLVEVAKDLHNLDMLFSDRVDFVLMDKYTASNLMIENRHHFIGHLEFMQPPLAINQFHIAFPKNKNNSYKLAEDFDRGLESMEKDGTLKSIQIKHGLLARNRIDDKKIHLTIGAVNNHDMMIMESLTEEFEQKHPQIELEWRQMDELTLRTRLLSDIALSEGTFDVIMIGNYEVPIWAENGWITEIKTVLDGYDLKDILPSVRASLTYQNQLHALPFYAESVVTYYRKDLFRKAEIQMPEQPTYDQIKKYARAIHDPDNQTYGICLRGKPGWGNNMALITSMVQAYGGRWFYMKWQPQLNSPEWKGALDYYVDIISQFGPPNPASYGYTENLKLFAAGQCGIWIDATVASGYLFNEEISEVADKVGIVAAPTKKNTSNWLWVWSLAIPKSSLQKEAAKTFIEWATSKDYVQAVASQKGWLSIPPGTRRSTYNLPEYKSVAPFSDFIFKAIESANDKGAADLPVPYSGAQFVAIPEYVTFGGYVGRKVADILKGKITIQQALDQSQRQVQKQIIASGYID